MIATCHKSIEESDSLGCGGPTWDITSNFFVTFHLISHTYDINIKEVASP
jgi:hypothetical protein